MGFQVSGVSFRNAARQLGMSKISIRTQPESSSNRDPTEMASDTAFIYLQFAD